jgi:hypothetical protein
MNGELGEALALGLGRAARGAAHHQPLDLAAQLDQPQLPLDVDVGDDHAPAWQDLHEALARETLQRFADRRAADAQPLGQHRLGHRAAGRQLQAHDQLLERRVGAVGERLRRAVVGGGPRAPRRYACRRFCTRPRNFSYSLSSTP